MQKEIDNFNTMIEDLKLSDIRLFKILNELISSPKTASLLSQRTDMSISSVYKYIKKLEKNNLVKFDHIELDDKSKTIYFKTIIKSYNIVLSESGLEVHVVIK